MSDNSVTFKQIDQGAFFCASFSFSPPQSHDKLCGITIEFVGYRFYVSLFFMGSSSRVYGRTYYSKRIDSVESYLRTLSIHLLEQDCVNCRLDGEVFAALSAQQILLNFDQG